MANINHDCDKASELEQANITKSPLLKPNLSSLHNLSYNPQVFFVRKEKKLNQKAYKRKKKRNQPKTDPFIIHISLRFAEESREVGSERA